MKRLPLCLHVTGLLLYIFLGAGSTLAAGAAKDLTVAVFDFEADDAHLKDTGSQLAVLMTASLSHQQDLNLVERQDLLKLLGEQELSVMGFVNPASAARLGQLTGAQVLITGRLFTAGGETTVALKIMSCETSRIFGESITLATDKPIKGPAEQLAVKVAALLHAQAGKLVADIPTAEDRVAKLKQKLAGRTLPSITISLPEQHFGRPVVDPAAATEIGLILGQAGFKILAPEKAAEADFQIAGEAFSEIAGRRGSLISCRARVEIKVTRRQDGRVTLMDRQVAVAVDAAEHVGAKTALQHAGEALAERIASAIAITP